MLSHRLDYGHHLIGPFARISALMHRVYDTRVDAAGASHPADVDDWVACIGTFRQGATACLESTKVASGRGDGATGHDLCEINGTGASASYRLGDPHGVQMGRKGGRFERVAVPESFWVEPGSPRDPRAGDPLQVFRYDQTWRFLQSILDGSPVGPSFRAGLDAQIVMAAIEQSAATGETVSIDRADPGVASRHITSPAVHETPPVWQRQPLSKQGCVGLARSVCRLSERAHGPQPRLLQPDRAGRRRRRFRGALFTLAPPTPRRPSLVADAAAQSYPSPAPAGARRSPRRGRPSRRTASSSRKRPQAATWCSSAS